MAAAASKKQPGPLVTALIFVVPMFFLLMFPVALYANAMALIDGYRASHGQAGAPGTATVESAFDGRRDEYCYGVFVPDDGGPEVETRIEVPGDCEEGQVVSARLMEGRPSPFDNFGDSRAWAQGAGDWGVFVALVVLFGLLSLLPLFALAAGGAILYRAAAGGVRKLRSGDGKAV